MGWDTENDGELSPLEEAEQIVATYLASQPAPAGSIAVAPGQTYLTRKHILICLREHLNVADEEDVDVIFSVALGTFLPGEPLWCHLVKAPGGGKTEYLRMFSGPHVVSRDSITPRTLVSGLKGTTAKDDLYPRLNGKLFIVKDFGGILSGKRDDAKAIFSQLRAAYDGYMEGSWGSGIPDKSYYSRFGMMTGVTSAIDMNRNHEGILGERFMRLNLRGNRVAAIKSASEGEGHEDEVREKLRNIVAAFLAQAGEWIEKDVLVEQRFIDQLNALADIVSQLRTPVIRDHTHFIRVMPDAEVGTRLVKQSRKLAKALANWRGRSIVSMEDYLTVRRVALDGIQGIRRPVIDALQAADTVFGRVRPLSTKEIATLCSQPYNTVAELLEDLWLLHIIDREGTATNTWAFKDVSRDLLTRAIIDPSPEMISRVQVIP